MNKIKREKIKDIIKDLNIINNSLQKVLDEEQDSFDNIPENLQSSDRALDSENAIDLMTEAVDNLTCIIDNLREI